MKHNVLFLFLKISHNGRKCPKISVVIVRIYKCCHIIKEFADFVVFLFRGAYEQKFQLPWLSFHVTFISDTKLGLVEMTRNNFFYQDTWHILQLIEYKLKHSLIEQRISINLSFIHIVNFHILFTFWESIGNCCGFTL